MKKYWFVITILLAINLNINAQKEIKYHLFNPTPYNQMRKMHTDRPDVTETPFTVDAGHFQWEFDFINFYRHPIGKSRRETDILLFNGIFKVGITDKIDIEWVFTANQWHFPENRKFAGDSLRSRRGFGDLGFRTKINLVGNYTEAFGIAIMPSFLFPLKNQASENLYIPGKSLIWVYPLMERWEIGGQFEVYNLRDLNFSNITNEFWTTLEIGYDINNKTSTFLELVSIKSKINAHINTLNTGFIWEVGRNFRIDFGTNLGLNSFSHTCIFTGFSARL